MAYQSASAILSVGLETVRGTAAATPTYMPLMKPKVAPLVTWLPDEGLRGSPAEVFDQMQGVRHDEWDFSGNVYADWFPILLRAALGSTDTVAGAGPYTHTIGLLNDGGGSQPPSCTIVDWDGANGFQMVGAQLETLSISVGAEKGFDFTCKFLAQPWTNIAKPTSAYSTEALMPGWDVAVTIGGSSVPYMEDMTLSIERKTIAVSTAGQQGPHTIFAAPINVAGTFKGVVDTTTDPFSTGATAYGLVRGAAAIPVVLVCTEPISGHIVQVTMSNVQFDKPERTREKPYLDINTAFRANANTTDAIVGYSPIKTVTTNGRSTAYAGS
jgi:hypothetical protein